MTKKRLKEYCEAEFENISTVAAEVFSLVQEGKSQYSVAELAAIAAFLHNCYNGIENILKRILYFRQEKLKDSPTWHKDLLKASFESEIISSQLYDLLSNYLSFRHFFVHAYSFTLKWEELNPLVEGLDRMLEKFKTAIYSYIEKRE